MLFECHFRIHTVITVRYNDVCVSILILHMHYNYASSHTTIPQISLGTHTPMLCMHAITHMMHHIHWAHGAHYIYGVHIYVAHDGHVSHWVHDFVAHGHMCPCMDHAGPAVAST